MMNIIGYVAQFSLKINIISYREYYCIPVYPAILFWNLANKIWVQSYLVHATCRNVLC